MSETVIELADGSKAIFDNEGKRLYIVSEDIARKVDLSENALSSAQELHAQGQSLMLSEEQLVSVSLAMANKSVLGNS